MRVISDRQADVQAGGRHLRMGTRLAALLLVASAASAQQPALRVYGIEDGLKFPQVFAVFQDSRGFLWAGTSYGLSRYDGHEFASLTKAQGLPHDSVRGIAEDGSGTIWVVTDLGVARIAAMGGTMGAPEVVPLPPALAALGPRVPSMIAAHGASLWLLDERGLMRFRGGRLDDVPLPPALAGPRAVALGPAEDAGVWVCAAARVALVGGDGQARVFAVPARLGPAAALVRMGSSVLLLQEDGVSRLAGDRFDPEPAWGLPHGLNPTGGVAFGAALAVLTPAHGAVLLRPGVPPRALTVGQGLPSNAVYGGAVDRDGLLWLATADGLVKVFDLELRSYPTRRPEIGAMVFAFARDAAGGLWVGHSEGATLIRGGRLEHYDACTSNSEEADVSALLAAPRGGVLAGTRHGLVLLRGRRVVRLPALPLAGAGRVFDLALDGEGWTWASTSDGVVRFRWDDDRERALDARAFTEAGGEPFAEARGIAPTADGKVWFGTDGRGVVRWDGATMRRFGREAGLRSGVCRAVLGRPEGVWVGTDLGLWLLSGGRATPVEAINRALTDRYVVAMTAGGGAVWLATPYEVVKIVNNRIVARIDQTLGLIGASMTAEECLAVDAGGSLLVGMVGGFTEVPRDWDARKWPDPRVLLLGAEDRAGRPVPDGAVLPHRHDTVTFAFASPSFLAEQRTRFQDRLVGYDAGWSQPHAYPRQRYTNLPAGDYLFEVRAVGEGGRVSPKPARFSFSVASPWWETVPARAGLVVAIGAAAYGIALMRTRRVRRRNEELEALVCERTRELADANRTLEQLATTDALTGIANRRVFQAQLASEWARAGREGRTLSLLMIDVDDFKAYNDALGHQTGDACLRRVAQVVAAHAARAGDVAARYGGEEFAVLLTGIGAEGTLAVAERVRAAVAGLGITHPASPAAPVVTISVGFASARPVPGALAATLVAAADAALYEAKRSGRNRVVAAAAADA